MESILDTFIISPYVHEQIIKILPEEKSEGIKSDELNCMRERERERERFTLHQKSPVLLGDGRMKF
jgi:hypothetical protein